jgi:hypothetical protein
MLTVNIDVLTASILTSTFRRNIDVGCGAQAGMAPSTTCGELVAAILTAARPIRHADTAVYALPAVAAQDG